MEKRQFLAAAALAGALPAFASSPKQPGSLKGPALLTVTGAGVKKNRAGLEPRDQLFTKHSVKFSSAYELDLAAISAQPVVSIRPTLEYDGKVHALSGPLLSDVLALAGIGANATGQLSMRAIDNYAPQISLADMRKYRFILATYMDGQPLGLGGLGPLWAVYDADRYPDRKELALPVRFAACPWGLYHIEVLPA